MPAPDGWSILHEGLKREPRVDWERESSRPDSISGIREDFERGRPNAVTLYVETVLARSPYPEAFRPSFSVYYEIASETAVADVSLPAPGGGEAYEAAAKSCLIRTADEIFRSCYTRFVWAAAVNGWIENGEDGSVCVLSLFAYRNVFEKISLPTIGLDEAVKRLQGAAAGPLAERRAVEPIFRVSRPDKVFVYGKGWVRA